MSANVSVSVVIATAGRPAALDLTLRSLAEVNLPAGWTVELVLVENAARHGAEALLQERSWAGWAARWYSYEPVKGKASALNRALSLAKGDVLLFSDDDVRFPVDWIQRMSEPIVAGRADAVAGGVRLAPELLRPWMARVHRAWLASTADYLSASEPSEMCGANMAVRRAVFDSIGGFDPELGPGITGGGEESLLSWQIKRAGFRLVGNFDAVIEHHPDPARLRYESWLRMARGKGEERAYQWHHWYHRAVARPRLTMLYLAAKLSLRRCVTRRRRPQEEGIEPWELSYVEDIAKCARYLKECRRPRNYERGGLRKRPALGAGSDAPGSG